MNIYTSKSGAILREYVRNIDLKSSRVAIFPEHGREVCSTIELEGRCFKRLEIKSVSIPKNVAGVVGFHPHDILCTECRQSRLKTCFE